ncbi:MAG: hypothetical protein V2B18_02035 [Pseudomonadota bacterium]
MRPNRQWVLIAVGTLLWTVAGLVATVPLWSTQGDPYGMVRYVLRMVFVMPLGTLMIISAVTAFDCYTPHDWLERIHENNLACGIVVAVLIYCVSWLVIQG